MVSMAIFVDDIAAIASNTIFSTPNQSPSTSVACARKKRRVRTFDSSEESLILLSAGAVPNLDCNRQSGIATDDFTLTFPSCLSRRTDCASSWRILEYVN